jgi:L-seryl-tRNA(Ser) seleniumtransferase
VGTSLVEVGAENLEDALGDTDVAAVLYPAHLESRPGALPLDEVLRIAHQKGVPVLVDAAGQVHPLDLFKSFTRRGADLVAYGAKYLGAPNSTGILCGKRALIDAVVPQGFVGFETSGQRQTFGRPFKLDRQEIVAVVVALQEWMATDHEARLRTLERRLQVISERLEGAPGVTMRVISEAGAHARSLEVALDSSAARLDVRGLVQALTDGNPAIAVRATERAVLLDPVTLFDGDEEVVADRLAELLR